MWISKSEWDDLNKRIRELENSVTYKQPTMRIYEVLEKYATCYDRGFRKSIEITLETAIRDVARHVGLEFKYIEGKPPAAELVPIPKAKK